MPPFLPRVVAFLSLVASAALASAADKPLLRDFIGINGHTVQFRPALYAPVAKLVRDYHPLDWDTGENPGAVTEFPFARNRVHWPTVYRPWIDAGQRVHACLMFDGVKPAAWTDPRADGERYGRAFGTAFGPQSATPLVESVEIGNEPGLYDDATYRAIFEGMARGLRATAPKLLVSTCAADAGKSERYWKSLGAVRGLEDLYDVISVHIYAEATGWPTWKRSFPEDESVDAFLPRLRRIIAWRDAHAPRKQVWVTEFGWDATTRKPAPTGDFAQWQGSVSDDDQARYLVRSYLVFAGMAVDRAYLYFFDDKDEPQLHGASGITRNFQPKPSYHALAWLQRSLGHHRFAKSHAASVADGFATEFAPEKATEARVFACWRPTGPASDVKVPAKGRVLRAETMPLAPGDAPKATASLADGTLTVYAGASPVLVWVQPAGS